MPQEKTSKNVIDNAAMNHVIQKSLFCSKYTSEDTILEQIINGLKSIKHFNNNSDFLKVSIILSQKKRVLYQKSDFTLEDVRRMTMLSTLVKKKQLMLNVDCYCMPDTVLNTLRVLTYIGFADNHVRTILLYPVYR